MLPQCEQRAPNVAHPPTGTGHLNRRGGLLIGNRYLHRDAIVQRNHGTVATVARGIGEIPQQVFATMHAIRECRFDGMIENATRITLLEETWLVIW
jgi:hypothetical protein